MWILAVTAALGGSAPGQAPSPSWTTGRWRVEDRALGLPCRLSRIELKPAPSRGDKPIVVAFEPDGDGRERIWGTSRLDTIRGDGAPARVEWNDGGSVVVVLLRPLAGGRLSAVVRERARGRAPTGPERVRQVLLVPDDERNVSNAPLTAARPLPMPTTAPRGELGVLYAVDIEGGAARVVAVPDGYARAAHPSWSPEGRRIAFTAFDATGRDPLIRITTAQGGPTVAVAAGVGPRWSGDGTRLAYMASGRPEFATDWEPPGRNEERIESVRLNGPGAGEAEILAKGIWPRWAPTDDRLAFVARVGTSWDVYVRSADGSAVTRVTDDPATDTFPCWRPDGRAVIFLSDRGNRWDLWEVPTSGRAEPQRLTNVLRREDEPDISPDGRRVAFTDGLGRRDSQILLLELGAGTIRPLVEGAQGDRNPCWSPDGKSIAFASRRPAPLLPAPPGR
jgi:dipeptidyl aminopeptidase/acylaminoacyl peptidase